MRTLIIYPAYFNTEYTRNQGRRVPKHLSTRVNIEALINAARELGFNYTVTEKTYPREWNKMNKVLEIDTELPKAQVLNQLAKKMQELQSSA